MTQDLWLPKRHETQTATLVISNSTDTYSTDLVYTQTWSGDRQLCRVPISSSCLHIQGPGSQSNGFLHSVHCHRESSIDGGVYRFHCTFRFTLVQRTTNMSLRHALQLNLVWVIWRYQQRKGKDQRITWRIMFLPIVFHTRLIKEWCKN